MSKVTLEQVSKSYNGKSGCMCGCNGRYTLPSHADIAAANKATGYEAYEAEDVSNRRVNIAVRKVNAALDQYADEMTDGEYNKNGLRVGRTDDFAWVDDGNRNTVVYF